MTDNKYFYVSKEKHMHTSMPCNKKIKKKVQHVSFVFINV